MKFTYTILLVEDEREPGEMLANFLEMNEFNVLYAEDGKTALNMIETRANEINLAILDIMVPHYSGMELCAHIRKHPVLSDIPVIFLTAKDRELDEIDGLSVGADDYITKPASLNLVLAHVNSLLRRRQSAGNTKWIRFAEVYLDLESMQVYAGQQKLELTATELQILQMFFQNPKRVYTRVEILEHISDDDKFVFDRTVDVHIKNLRIKLGDHADVVKTYRGVGYGLNKDVIK